ncbi:hypothetical protein CDD82_1656 [Ophiocordyceps australis]|uniref:Superoxide dismutase n=1 Tax=Ophiocordyceps australis TaxID=1399860 RepID=A0A2C5YFH1_9HYPO|nr:hypothetical protein CDD82_1656 [Ophiocordyceps australis]
MSATLFSLPNLPYAYNALEPAISAQIMQLHHSKHHAAYVSNLNAALKAQAAAVAANDIAQQIALQPAIRFNGGGHINHSLFWHGLAPAGSAATNAQDAAPSLTAAVVSTWGSLAAFRAEFAKALLGLQGSGWGWLVKDEQTAVLRIVTTKDQDVVAGGQVPVVGIDMWEHAYYLQYLNGKSAYVENMWNVINWQTAESRFQGSRGDALRGLLASL